MRFIVNRLFLFLFLTKDLFEFETKFNPDSQKCITPVCTGPASNPDGARMWHLEPWVDGEAPPSRSRQAEPLVVQCLSVELYAPSPGISVRRLCPKAAFPAYPRTSIAKSRFRASGAGVPHSGVATCAPFSLPPPCARRQCARVQPRLRRSQPWAPTSRGSRGSWAG